MPKLYDTDVDKAIDFMRFLFGDKPAGFIATLKSKPGDNKPPPDADDLEEGQKPQKPRSTEVCHAYSRPEKVNSEWWRNYSTKYNIWFCTATVKDRTRRHSAANSIDIPAIWFDLDACKYLGVPGKAFYADIKGQEEISAWVQSSEHAFQGYYKLDEPYELRGDKKAFKEDLRDLLLKIAMYYGGDFKVVSPARLMRLPGSLNLKPEYPKPYEVIAHTTDQIFTLKKLKKKFKNVDENTVPKVISFAITYIMQNSELWTEGTRHDMMYRLAGTIRKMGINKEACLNLFSQLETLLGDNEYREADVLSTYDAADMEQLASLRSGYGEIAEAIEGVIKFWLDLKVEYCKKQRIKFVAENFDPTKPSVNADEMENKGDGSFYTRNYCTYYHGDDNDEMFSNFAIQIRGKLVKADSGDTVWLANIITAGQPVKTIEITTASHNTWATFSKIPHIPTGLTLYQQKMWPHYIGWLAQTCPEDTFIESTYYGWLDIDKPEPTLLLPNEEHERYIWTRNNEDTMEKDGMFRELDSKKVKQYLTKFAECYPTYHEEQLIWPTLGWFASAPMSAFFRREMDGFPTLVIYGLAGSGKSQIIKKVMGPHFGCKGECTYASSTAFFIRAHMLSNNICPTLLDEFKEDGGVRTTKASEFLGIIRSAWDGLEGGAGKSDGTVRKDRFQTPMCVVGEHLYGEDATLHRTFSISVNHDYLYKFDSDLDDEERAVLNARSRWLDDKSHQGWMGTLVLNWIIKNREEAIDLMRQCLLKVDTDCPRDIVPRKRSGFSAPLFGLHVMKRIFDSYGVAFPLKTKRFLPLILEADPSSKNTDYSTSALTELFKATDATISRANVAGRPLKGSMFIIDIKNPNTAYFDINRWRAEIKSSFNGGTSSAALTNDIAFHNMLKDCARREGGPIVGFPDDHPIFEEMCVQINLSKVRKVFKINTQHWSNNYVEE